MLDEQYPERCSHFAHKFVRLLTKSAAAQEIGPEGCWLLSVIAHQEDAKRYSGPVTFWNGQLMPLCGVNSEKRLIRVRNAAVAAGWLHYDAGGKSKPGRYWCCIPDEFGGLDDTPVDETDSVSPVKSQVQTAVIRQDKRSQNGSHPQVQSQDKRSQKGGHSTLYPDPDPTPKEIPPLPPKGGKTRKTISVADITFPDSMNSPAVVSAMAEWIEHHKAIGKPYRTTAFASKLFRQFERAGPAAFVEAVNNSIANNYQGVFPPKGAASAQSKYQRQQSEFERAFSGDDDSPGGHQGTVLNLH